MTAGTITNDTVWVLAPKDRVANEEREVFDQDNLYLLMADTPVTGDGLLVFTTEEAAEKYVRDGNRADMEVKRMPQFMFNMRFLAKRFPNLTCIVLDPVSGHPYARLVSLDDLLRGGP